MDSTFRRYASSARLQLFVAAATTLISGADGALADIVGVGGAAVVAEPPPNIQNGEWTSNTEIRCWFERETILATDVTLNHGAPGFVGLAASLSPVSLPSGTPCQSHMLRLDPATGALIELTGFAVFDTPILGVVVLENGPFNLNLTDEIFGRPDVTYNNNNNRGLELGDQLNGNDFTISVDRLRIDFSMNVNSGPTDDIRVVNEVSEQCRGDLDGDGSVSLQDLTSLLSHFGGPGNLSDGDLDGDGDVDLQDLARLLSNFGTTFP